MPVTRRTFMKASVAATTVAAVGATVQGTALSPAAAASPPGDVVGKISVGYQGWFAATGDGSPINGWWHWSNNLSQAPNPSNGSIVSWPDVREYTRTYQTGYAALGNGQPARLFSHYDQQSIDTHFAWMRDYGIDTAALQRFNPTGGEGPIRDAITVKVRTAAEATGRKFYIMYDVTSWTAMQSQIKTDWTTKMSAYTTSPAYARQNGKPVVCIWGFGFNDSGRPFAPAECLEVVNWFKAQGCYVIGGVPTYWRQGINDSRPGFGDVYRAFHMISPWMVGRVGDLAGLDSFYTNVNTPDQAECNARGIDYQPCVMPGDLSAGHRRHGDFYWRHLYNMIRVGAQGLYVSMFDEYNEGNQIAKTAENRTQVPTNFPGRTLDEDGTTCSSDYYLRLTGDGGRMLKGLIALTAVRPTQPQVGGGGGTGPTFYSEAGFAGAAVTLGTGSYDMAQLQAAGIANDSISSIRVPAGFTVTAYEHAGFTGAAWTFTADNANLSNTGNNDAISSLRVATGGVAGPTFYLDANYAGASATLGAGSYDLAQLQAAGLVNDAISSIRVPSGYTVTAYADAGFSGTAWTFTRDTPNLVSTGNDDAISSLRVTRNGAGPTFYLDANYTGASATLGAGSYDLAQLQAAGLANDAISSIRVPAGYRVTAYADAGFSGTAWTFTADNPNLLNTGNNDAISSLRVTAL